MKAENLTDIMKEYGGHTPMYIFDIDELKDRVEKIKGRMPGNGGVCYAVKANPFLIPELDDMIDKYEVCSPGELQICKRSNIRGDKIVYSGVNKGEDDIADAIGYGARFLTVESEKQLEVINRCAGEAGTKVQVLIRLTSGTQFGVDESVLEDMIVRRDEYPYVHFAGIQFFSGTQKKEKKIRDELQYLAAYYKGLGEKYAYYPAVMEYGPGLPVPYFEGENFADELEMMDVLRDTLEREGKEIRWEIEMGRYVAASCGYYVTKVIDTKVNHEKNYCIVDGGINHVNYYGQNMAMRVPLIEHIPQGEIPDTEETKDWVICGSLCTTADVLVRKTGRTGLKEGDLLVFKNIGAYSMTEGIYLFLSRRMPEIYRYSLSEGMALIREGVETYRWNEGGIV